MKTLIPLLLFAFFVLLGCEDKPINDVNEVSDMPSIDSQIKEIESEIGEIEELVKGLPGSTMNRPMGQPALLLSDKLNVLIGRTNLKTTKANLEVTKSTLEASRKLVQSIDQFDESSTNLSNKMLWLTRFIAFLTVVLTVMAFFQIIETPTIKHLYHKMTSSFHESNEPESAVITNKVTKKDPKQKSKLTGVKEQEPEEPEPPIKSDEN